MTTPTEHENGPETAAHEPTDALLPESAYVCEDCGHLWTERRPEDDSERGRLVLCAFCHHRQVRVFPLRIVGNREAAEEFSENVMSAMAQRDYGS